MSLIELWTASPEQLSDKHVQQIIAFAGTGKLLDGNEASAEFRDFLAHVSSTLLANYADQCLCDRFENGGLALQDIVNQIGQRLGFLVIDGRYRGKQSAIGFDGIWSTGEGLEIVVEVKTTDAYRIDLSKIAEYRKQLIKADRLSADRSSILIIVGRDDTGDLEAQIRGSQHAWDIRLISVDSLVRLMNIREELEDPATARKIASVLIPHEYTKVDRIIDLVFSTTEDVLKLDAVEDADTSGFAEKPTVPKFVPVKFNDACVARVQDHIHSILVKRSRVAFSSPDGSLALICAVSKKHDEHAAKSYYWFAFRPHQQEFLKQASASFVAFGCGSAGKVLLIPFKEFEPLLGDMNMTRRDGSFYWHIQIFEENGRFMLVRRKGKTKYELTKHLIPRVR